MDKNKCKKVLCFGSLNIDYTYKVEHFVKKGETLSSQGLVVSSGGKGLNQSVALAKSGANVYHGGAVGEDGGFLLDILNEAKVNTSLINVSKEVRTGNAIIQNDIEGDNCIILYGGANQSITKKQVDNTLEGFEPGDYLILQNEINELPYIIEVGKKKGMVIVLNPSPMNDSLRRIDMKQIDYIILNEIEASQLIVQDTQDRMDKYEGVLDELHEMYPTSRIVLTIGENGCWYIDDKQKLYQSSYKVNAVDTTAAGDTFTGYFIGEIIKGADVKDALRIASKAASIAVSRQGAAASIPNSYEVQI